VLQLRRLATQVFVVAVPVLLVVIETAGGRPPTRPAPKEVQPMRQVQRPPTRPRKANPPAGPAHLEGGRPSGAGWSA
jgi:hypothetical protein